MDNEGKEIIKDYRKIGTILETFPLEALVPEENTNIKKGLNII